MSVYRSEAPPLRLEDKSRITARAIDHSELFTKDLSRDTAANKKATNNVAEHAVHHNQRPKGVQLHLDFLSHRRLSIPA